MVSQRRPHLLYVAWGFPPSRGAGVYRALATANAFSEAGWKVTVLTATREVFEYQTGTDTALERLIDPDINVVRADFDWIRGEPDISKWSKARLASNLLWTFLRGKKDLLSFPEPVYGAWKKPLLQQTARIHEESPIDLVVGSANPNVDFMPGWFLHRTAGVPFVMDHRDAWNMDVYTGKRIGSPLSRSARLERKMMKAAAEVWFVNAPIRDWHATEYPENSKTYHVVANAFDATFAEKFAGKVPAQHTDEGGLTFGYLGTIYGPIPLRETLEGWRLARSLSPIAAKSRLVIRGRLGHYAEPDPAILKLLEEYSQDGVSYGGPVSKTEVADVYSGFHALLLIIGKSPYVTSGKVFEYAATGLPIGSLHHPDSAASTILSGHNDWFPVKEVSPADICSAILETAERAAEMTPEDYARNQEWADHLSRDKQLHPRISHLTKLVAEASHG